ncbi:MAG: anti-sigma factor antagonist [Deltaproteobacteria bacterium]|nr:MAG: anti-sigma factor antagonist [Deltaproteobacteria bacterium]
MFNIVHEETDQALVVKLSGQLTSVTQASLQQEVDSLVETSKPCLVVDVSSLLSIDSAGVGLLVGIYKKFREKNKDFKIAGLHGQPYDIFKLLNLHKVLDLAPTLEEALAPPTS